jgi:hypothetical protein
VNFPPLSSRPLQSIGEIGSDGKSHPYPGGEWNTWQPGKPVEHAFVGRMLSASDRKAVYG